MRPILFMLASPLFAIADDAKYPIPQDSEAVTAAREYRQKYQKWMIVEPFLKAGNQSAAWSKQALEALTDVAEYNAKNYHHITYDQPPILKKIKAAISAGCDDPLILHFETVFSFEFNAKPTAWWAARMKTVVEKLEIQQYPLQRLMLAKWNYLVWYTEANKGRANVNEERKRIREDFWATFEKLAAEKNAWADRCIAENLESMFKYHAALQMTLSGWKKIDAAFEAANASPWLRNYAKGQFQIFYAWEARGTKFAADVTDEQIAKFKSRLKVAKTALNASWEAEPLRPGPSALMITVSMGLGGERDEMETWFRRAMEQDPDDYLACKRKSTWLLPKWHGDLESLTLFLKQCRDTKNDEGCLPVLATSVFLEELRPALPKLLAKEAPTHELVFPVLHARLDKHPKDHDRRSILFCFYVMIEDWDAADQQYKLLPDGYTCPPRALDYEAMKSIYLEHKK